jgi:hypothetical protein
VFLSCQFVVIRPICEGELEREREREREREIEKMCEILEF